MLVQDDRTMREQYAADLRHAGFRVAEAENGVQALEMVTVLAPDVIIADLDIPSIDGLAFCRRLRSDPRRTDIPLITLASRPVHGTTDGPGDGSDGEMDARLAKPCPSARLLAEVQYLAGVTASRRDHAARARQARDGHVAYLDAGRLEQMRREFDDLPSLRLTVEQAQRLWHGSYDETEALLQALVADGFLQPAGGGRYERASAPGALPRPRMAKADVDAARPPAGRRRSDGSRS